MRGLGFKVGSCVCGPIAKVFRGSEVSRQDQKGVLPGKINNADTELKCLTSLSVMKSTATRKLA